MLIYVHVLKAGRERLWWRMNGRELKILCTREAVYKGPILKVCMFYIVPLKYAFFWTFCMFGHPFTQQLFYSSTFISQSHTSTSNLTPPTWSILEWFISYSTETMSMCVFLIQFHTYTHKKSQNQQHSRNQLKILSIRWYYIHVHWLVNKKDVMCLISMNIHSTSSQRTLQQVWNITYC